MMKLTREQAQSRKDKAVRFVETVLGDPDRAEEIAAEGLEDYASRRHIQLINPQGGKMARVRIFNPARVSGSNPRLRRLPSATPPSPTPASAAVPVANPMQVATQLVDLQRQNQILQDQNDAYEDKLDRIADLANCDDPDEDEDDLKESLNDILDIAAPGEAVDDDDEDDDKSDDKGDDQDDD